MAGGEERRGCDRRAVYLECRLEGASGSVSARIADLSISGCYVDTLMQVVKDARAAITVTLDGEEIQLTGIVVYVHDKQGFAVRFDELPDATRETLEQFVRPSPSHQFDVQSSVPADGYDPVAFRDTDGDEG